MTITIALVKDHGIRTGSITIDATRYDLASWHVAAERTTYATTTDGQRVTLATNAPTDAGWITGSLCIGNTDDAPRWLLHGCRRYGGTLTGHATPTPDDVWLAGFIERTAGMMRG